MVKQVTNGSIAPLERNQNYLEMTVRLEPPFETGHAQAMAATIYANWLDVGPIAEDPTFPLVALIVSGGHSDLVLSDGHGRYRRLGRRCFSPADRLREHRNVADVASDGESKRDCYSHAIGATRNRLVRQLITETACIAAIAGVCGWFVSIYLEQLMLSFLPATAEAWQFSPNVRIFAATFVVACASGLLFGLAPAVQLARHQAVMLRSRTPPARTIWRILDSRDVLTVVQIALTILLLTGGTLRANAAESSGCGHGLQPRPHPAGVDRSSQEWV